MADLGARDSAKTFVLKTLAFAKDVKMDTSPDTIKGKLNALERMWDRFEVNHTSVLMRSGSAEVEFSDIGYDDVLESYCSAKTLLESTISQQIVFKDFNTDCQLIAKQLEMSNEAAGADEAVISAHLNSLRRTFEHVTKLLPSCISAGVSSRQMHERFTTTQAHYATAVAKWEQGAKRFIPAAVVQPVGAPVAEAAPALREFRVSPISIPKFLGNSENWEAFRDMFAKGFHERVDMSKVVKFQHLKASLSGEAELIVRNIPISEDNYDTAWALLKRHYDNIPALIKTHLRTLFNQGKCGSSATELGRMLSKTVSSVQALKNLECPTEHWDDILVFLITDKLDSESIKIWEQIQSTREERSTWADLEQFLFSRVRTLTSIGQVHSKAVASTSKVTKSTVHVHQVSSQAAPTSRGQPRAVKHVCADCKRAHRVNFCPVFRTRPAAERVTFIAQKALCINCFGSGHSVEHCPTERSCYKCGQRHNTLLHIDPSSENVVVACSSSTFSDSIPTRSKVLLSTARVHLHTPHQTVVLRALLDQGSQSSFITESAAQLFQLPRRRSNVSVIGLANSKAGTATSSVLLHLGSTKESSSSFSVNALVLRKLASLEKSGRCVSNWEHFQDLELADPSFANEDTIDIILGADIYGSLLLNGLRKGPPGTPTAQRTVLGWIISGPTAENSPPTEVAVHCGLVIEEELRKFWEIEEVSKERVLTKDELACEQFYADTYRRGPDGRFIVRIPLHLPVAKLGESYNTAAVRMYGMERRFQRDPRFHEQYKQFIDQYLSLGHMEPVLQASPISFPSSPLYYIPHHAVLKESSSTTKLRVVFDASRKTSNGLSLNEQMYVGPRLQQDLFSIILRWRKHKVVFTADIEKMFRQITVDPRDRDLQRILWRSSDQDQLKPYRLTTVTYGTSAAPYLAIKTIRQLAENEHHLFPAGSDVLLQDAYVDDILSGAADVASCLEIQRQLISLLKSGGFILKKWTSNSDDLLTHLPADFRECQLPLNLNIDDNVKTLGIEWNPSLDQFSFSVSISPPPSTVTKRNLLSDASKLYDPLGWLAPSIVLAKLMFQHLWTLNLGWDDPLPSELAEEWLSFRQGLSGLRNVRIPRWVLTGPSILECQLHGFSDASMKAYAAVVYLRVTDSIGHISTSILSSKSKVAPLKTISLPKLELCGAVLLSRLMDMVVSSMELPNTATFAWTDSEIVLSWLKSSPSRWNIFVANRISEIQGSSSQSSWKHVISADNPADLASRGIHPTTLEHQALWWEGPKWLRSSSSKPATRHPRRGKNSFH